MSLALEQAKINLGNTKENPSVGCVITKKNSIISLGRTSTKGRPHAEKNAIDFSTTSLNNASLYVTLEPCSHYGLTAPCTKKIIKKKIKKVFFSIIDPDKRSKNKSTKLLNSNRIIVNKGILSKQVKDFYRSYYKSKNSILPFVTCKLAISKDYFTINKKNKWITNDFSRSRGHLIRSLNDCIITTSRTISTDNSKLTCRIPGLIDRTPSRIILDRCLKIPLNSHVIKDADKYKTIIFYNKDNLKKIKMLKKNKVKLFKIPIDKYNQLNLDKALIKAKTLGFNRVLLESGITITNNFFKKNLVDDLYIFVSNKNLGKNGMANIGEKIKLFLKRKKSYKEKVNLFGEKLLKFKIK